MAGATRTLQYRRDDAESCAVPLVDTSVWIDHLRLPDHPLTGRLSVGEVLGHPWVRGELALGQLAARATVLSLLAALRQAALARPDEVLSLIEVHAIQGSGIGWVDALLLASRA